VQHLPFGSRCFVVTRLLLSLLPLLLHFVYVVVVAAILTKTLRDVVVILFPLLSLRCVALFTLLHASCTLLFTLPIFVDSTTLRYGVTVALRIFPLRFTAFYIFYWFGSTCSGLLRLFWLRLGVVGAFTLPLHAFSFTEFYLWLRFTFAHGGLPARSLYRCRGASFV